MLKKANLFRKIMLSAAAIASFTISIYADDLTSKPIHVRVFDNGKCTFLSYSDNITVGDLLKENNFILEDEDRIDQNLSDDISNDMRINIERANIVNVTIDNKVYKSFKTGCETVGKLMSRMSSEDNTEYVVASDKYYSSMKITDNMDLEISTVNSEITIKTEEIPFETVKVEDDKLKKGVTKVTTQGKNGIRTIKYKNTYVGGELKSTEEDSNEITKEPINEVIAVGTYVEPAPQVPTVNTGNGVYTFSKEMTMNATAYSSQSQGCNNYTATGMLARKGVVAVDKNVIPLGTKLYIPGYGEAVAGDVGGAIKGNKIDLCFNSYSECVQFGRKNMKVYVLSNKIS